jgi:acetyl-CoA C-acetyltransferase
MMRDHPVIIGVGQVTDRNADPGTSLHPLQLALRAVMACAGDTGAPGIINHVDVVSVVNIFSWQYRDPAGQLCAMLGIDPPVKEYTTVGGNSPQWLVNRAADRIAAGEIGAALLVGTEGMYTTQSMGRKNAVPPWPVCEQLAAGMIGDTRYGMAPHEMLHRAEVPSQVYPLFENALRAERGLSMDEQRKLMGDLWAGFSRTASENPLAWFRDPLTGPEISGVSDKNRMIGFPYTKLMNPVLAVNQAAAVIIAGAKTAEKFSVPKNKRVFLHGGADAADKWFLSERVSYTFSPAIKEVGKAAMEMAGIDISRINLFDLYSCYPCAVIIGARSLGLDINHLPPLTVTGGLAYFGGPGNNYTMHAIARTVEKLRDNPEQFGYVSALGWFITKHSAGIYSIREPGAPWDRSGQGAIQQVIDREQAPVLNMSPRGRITVETYMVMHDRGGAPAFAIVIGRLEDGERCWGVVEHDVDTFVAMEAEEFVGKVGLISPGDNSPNLVRF